MRRARRLSGERGAAIVEMIIVLPLLLFVVFAIVELSRAWFTLQLTTAAIRDGARAAAVAASGSVAALGEARINSILNAGGITTSSQGARIVAPPGPSVTVANIPCVTPPPPAACPSPPDQEVVATVTVRFDTLFPLLPNRLRNLNLTQTARMRWEGS